MNEIKCEYAYDGNYSDITKEKEKWEIKPFAKDVKCYIVARIIAQDFSETIEISKAMYDKIMLNVDEDLASYLKTAYETWMLNKKIKP
jgi:hypothetical protein